MIHPRVISLDRTPHRLEIFRAHNPDLAFERFAAIDGSLGSRQDWIDSGLISDDNIYVPGALGCAASHVALWRDCVATGTPVTIIEDDVILRGDFVPVASALLRDASWDAVFWTWNFNWPLDHWPAEGLDSALLQLDPHLIAQHYDAFRAHRAPAMLARLRSGACFGCYTLAPAGAAILLELCLPVGAAPARIRAGNLLLDWDNTGIDVEASRHFTALRAFVAIPPLAVPINDGALSTIRGPDAPI